MEKGKRNWVFCDGYLPPHGDDPAFQGHEALMLTNLEPISSWYSSSRKSRRRKASSSSWRGCAPDASGWINRWASAG